MPSLNGSTSTSNYPQKRHVSRHLTGAGIGAMLSTREEGAQYCAGRSKDLNLMYTEKRGSTYHRLDI